MTEISDWDRIYMIDESECNIFNDEKNKFDTILDFAQKLINNSKNIDSEFIEIVDEHFWDII